MGKKMASRWNLYLQFCEIYHLLACLLTICILTLALDLFMVCQFSCWTLLDQSNLNMCFNQHQSSKEEVHSK